MTNSNAALNQTASQPPAVEARVASIVASLLEERGSRPEADDIESGDFFELGGNSMLAARLVVKLRKEFEVDISIRDVFRGRTVAVISRTVRARLGAE